MLAAASPAAAEVTTAVGTGDGEGVELVGVACAGVAPPLHAQSIANKIIGNERRYDTLHRFAQCAHQARALHVM